MSELPEHVRRNRDVWDENAAEYVEPGRRNWAAAEPTWGIWDVPEADVGMVPEVRGLDAIELGCGTAYVSAWLARRGARPVGIDNSEAQLASARANGSCGRTSACTASSGPTTTPSSSTSRTGR